MKEVKLSACGQVLEGLALKEADTQVRRAAAWALAAAAIAARGGPNPGAASRPGAALILFEAFP